MGRVRQLTYVAYVCTSTFIGVPMILDMRTLTVTLFKILQHFSGFYNFIQFKNLLLHIWPFDLIHLFFLEETDFLLFTFVLKKFFFSQFFKRTI